MQRGNISCWHTWKVDLTHFYLKQETLLTKICKFMVSGKLRTECVIKTVILTYFVRFAVGMIPKTSIYFL